MQLRLAHRGVRSSQATPAAVDKSFGLEHKNSDTPSEVPELQNLELLAALPEWQTPLPGGDRPSCTDILALASNDAGLCVLAVEAKVDEDFGPRLGEKRREASAGQLERIQYLESLLGGEALADDLRYQLLHRTASALLTAEKFHAATAVMLIHSFGTRPQLKDDFNNFSAAVKARDAGGTLREAAGQTARRLFLAWCDGSPEFVNTSLPPCEEFI